MISSLLERYFRLSANGTTPRTELLAGVTTFLTMAYIVFVQPAVLSGVMFGIETGMDFGAVMTATCISAALATAIMGLYARYPIAQAPGMGQNFFFVFTVLPAAAAAGIANAWQAALGAVFISGVIFLLISIAGLRGMVMDSVSPSLKNAIAVGIGLFIAFIGLQNTGLIVASPGTLVKMTSGFRSPDVLVFFLGLFVTLILHARGVRGAIIWGIVAGTLCAAFLKLGAPHLGFLMGTEAAAESKLMTQFTVASSVVSLPPSMEPTFFKMDLRAAVSLVMIPFILVFLFMDVFDTMGTLIGVSEQAGLVVDNKLPRAEKAMISDAAGTVIGAALGTSTVTSFIESASGVQQGGRTGLTAVTVSVLFLLVLFVSPVVAMVGSYGVITAPALLLVGSFMVQNVRKIDWSDFSEVFPAFLIILGIPLTFSIADGMALGLVSYPVVKLCSGKGREVKLPMYMLAVVLAAYFVFLRGGG